jgi:DNA ligase-associated metallophosphoesterase
MLKTQENFLFDQHLILHPERALFWKDKNLLIVADPHFGKAQIFRSNGIPVPKGTTAGDLDRLSHLIDQLQPTSLLFLGDLIHDRIDNYLEFSRLLDQWRRRHNNVQLYLVTGNHDRFSKKSLAYFRFDQVAAEISMNPFVFTHKPKLGNAFYGIAGHLHPAVYLKGKGHLKENLPCFCFGTRNALLPAFGSFTGKHVIQPTRDDKIFVIAGDEVLEMRNKVS